jgi:hypothetical protein
VTGNLILRCLRDDYRALWRLEEGSRAKTEMDRSIKRKEHQLRKLLRAPVHRRLRRMLSTVSPLMLAIQRAISPSLLDALSQGARGEYVASAVPEPDLIRDADVRRDILAHRAAAIAAGHLTELVPDWLRRVVPDLADTPPSALDDPATRVAIAARHPFLASEAGLELLQQWMRDRSLSLSPTLATAMRFWRDLFSSNGVSDPRLEHTLAILPEDIPDFLICALGHVRLRRPLTDRLELLVTTLVARRHSYRLLLTDAPDRQAGVLLDARREDIVRAMHLVSTHLGWTLEPKYEGHVSTFVEFVLGYAETQRDSLAGLAEQAIADHLRALERDRSEVVATLGASTPSARPPIPLPDIPGVRFLGTVGEIADVGLKLRIGLARDAPSAVEGRCYLFHVAHDGEEETVGVSADGWVWMPKYSTRRMRWGEKALDAWAAALRPPPRPYVADALPV